MNKQQLEELITDCPLLYHMAERGAWTGIQRHGLLSTTALLDLFGIKGEMRETIERKHRPAIVSLYDKKLGNAHIRDQIPMSDGGLRRALPADISPATWYERLNSMVFFWMTKQRLLRLTGARAYRDVEHEVLVVDTHSLIDAYFQKIWLCPINSGCTKPMPHPRDHSIFQRIQSYDYTHWHSKRPRGERAVELCVDYSIPDIARFVVDGFIIRGSNKISSLTV